MPRRAVTRRAAPRKPQAVLQLWKNIALAFNMMKDLNIDIKDTRPEDIANLDLKSTLRITYALYNRYKYVE